MARGFVIAIVMTWAIVGRGDEGASPPRAEDPRIAELEQTVARLESEVESLRSFAAPNDGPVVIDAPVIIDAPAPGAPGSSHFLVYDRGWTLRPVDPERTPYELTISFFNQFRYTGFDTDARSVVDSAGDVVPTPSRSDFDINRGRVIFSGYAVDPLVEFYANIDYNTVSNQQIQMLLAWIRHPFRPAFNLAYGLGKVPGTWEWRERSRDSLGAEASLATTFFRPSITAGVWIDGELTPSLRYVAMVGDGFNTVTLNTSSLDTHFAYSGMLWWEPLGDFGPGFSDLETHADSVVRIGNAFTFARQDADPLGEPGPEQTVIRLSDGTRLVDPGALAPGATVNQFDLALQAIHAGRKFRGVSVSGEYFLRRIANIRATAPIPETSLFDHGFFVQSGAFCVPQTVELFAVGSAVFGPFGSGYQVGGGLNWYVKQTRGWRFTVDVARVEDSPAQQDRTGYVAGASGLLVRTQCAVDF